MNLEKLYTIYPLQSQTFVLNLLYYGDKHWDKYGTLVYK